MPELQTPIILMVLYSEALSRARLLLKMSHSHARLEQIWGAGGGQQPMPQLVDQVCTIVADHCAG